MNELFDPRIYPRPSHGHEAKTETDSVNHPKHYNIGKIEVIEVIEDWSLGYHRGIVVKYVARAGVKNPDKDIEDLEKAMWYLNRYIELRKSELKNSKLAKPNDTSISRQ